MPVYQIRNMKFFLAVFSMLVLGCHGKSEYLTKEKLDLNKAYMYLILYYEPFSRKFMKFELSFISSMSYTGQIPN
jgi:hypothetical protein